MGEIGVRGDARMRIGGEKKAPQCGARLYVCTGRLVLFSITLLLRHCYPPCLQPRAFRRGSPIVGSYSFPPPHPLAVHPRVKVREEYVVQKRM